MFVWLSPGRFVHGKELAWLGGIGLVLFICLGVVIFRDRHGLIRLGQALYRCKLAFLICLSILAYWAVLIVSRSFFDDRIPMDERLLSPFLVMGLILLGWSFANLWNRSRWVGRSIIAVVSLVLINGQSYPLGPNGSKLPPTRTRVFQRQGSYLRNLCLPEESPQYPPVQ